MRTTRAAAVALLLLALAASSAQAATFATVTGYAPGTAANNQPETWGADCVKIEPGGTSYVLEADASLVVVKAGAEASNPGHVNTLFADASAGQTVWADTNGNGTYDPDGPGGDKAISHVIVCPAGEPSSAPSDAPSSGPSTTPSDQPSEPVASVPVTGPTPPATDAAATGPSSGTTSAWSVIAISAAVTFVIAFGVAFVVAARPTRRR